MFISGTSVTDLRHPLLTLSRYKDVGRIVRKMGCVTYIDNPTDREPFLVSGERLRASPRLCPLASARMKSALDSKNPTFEERSGLKYFRS